MNLKKLVFAAVVSLPLVMTSAYATEGKQATKDSAAKRETVSQNVTVKGAIDWWSTITGNLRPHDPWCSPFPECA